MTKREETKQCESIPMEIQTEIVLLWLKTETPFACQVTPQSQMYECVDVITGDSGVQNVQSHFQRENPSACHRRLPDPVSRQ